MGGNGLWGWQCPNVRERITKSLQHSGQISVQISDQISGQNSGILFVNNMDWIFLSGSPQILSSHTFMKEQPNLYFEQHQERSFLIFHNDSYTVTALFSSLLC